MSIRHWLSGKLALLRGGRNRVADFDRELQTHLDEEAREHEDSGLSLEDARHAARRPSAM